jgi:hypothetical protein
VELAPPSPDADFLNEETKQPIIIQKRTTNPQRDLRLERNLDILFAIESIHCPLGHLRPPSHRDLWIAIRKPSDKFTALLKLNLRDGKLYGKGLIGGHQLKSTQKKEKKTSNPRQRRTNSRIIFHYGPINFYHLPSLLSDERANN